MGRPEAGAPALVGIQGLQCQGNLPKMAASNRKEGERIPTPSVPMEKIQMKPKCDFS